LASSGNTRTWVEVDLAALQRNAREVQRRSGARLLPMVKANAYGLGAVPVAKALEPLDPWGFGVATAEEGAELRRGGVVRPILVIQPAIDSLEACAREGLTPALGSTREVEAWRQLAGDRPFHAQIDTGMNRNGFWWEAFAEESRGFADAPGFEGAMTHYHSAETDARSVQDQWQRFQGVIGRLPRRPALLHGSNSAGALNHPEISADLVRPGIFLYGGAVGRHRPEPVVTWKARVSRIAWREAGTSVSYGATWRAGQRTCVVTIAAGYADGVRRALSNRGAMMLAGARCPIIGNVTMDFTMIRAEREPQPDDVATLIGGDLLLDEVAECASTISYEILTGLGSRVPRIHT
jgi:alanine racemase